MSPSDERAAQFLQTSSAWTEAAMEQLLPPGDEHPSELYRAMRYSVFGGGKRLRPALCYAAAAACGGEARDFWPVACALEFVHTYSLIHDDLPALDNDEYRRGRPTNHRVFGEAMALLAGDALLTLAFETVLRAPAESAVTVRLARELAVASGGLGMVAGQAADMLGEDRALDFGQLRFIHSRKTGALLRAAVRMGAIAAGGSDEALDALSGYAERIGLAFQIVDDILDVTGSASALGKSPGADAAHGKSTYPALMGLDESRREVRRLTDEAVELLAGARLTQTGVLEDLAHFLVRRDR